MHIRPFAPNDLQALYDISAITGLLGADATPLYVDPAMIGHLYSAPYATLEPSLSFVVEDASEVVGFAVGVLDTTAWEQQLEREWWPALRQRYQDPSDVPHNYHTPDQRRAHMIHHPAHTPTSVATAYPAHLHMNLISRARGLGVGSRLLQTWQEEANRKGAQGVHVGVNRANAGAIRFWSREGFSELQKDGEPVTRVLWMGRTPISGGPSQEG